MANQSYKARFIERTLHLFHQLNKCGLEIDQVAGLDCLPGGISAADWQEMQTAIEALHFMDEMPGGFFIYKAAGDEEIIYASRGVLEICQCDTLKEFREFTNNSFRSLVCSEDLESVEDSIRQQIAASQYDLDYMLYRVRRKDGSLCWVENYGHFIHGGSIGDVFYVFLGDPSDERNHQQVQQKRILTEALEKADMAEKAKSTFLSHISHEMRTPLNAIFGYASLAKISLHEPDTLSEYLVQMEIASHQLLNMITEVLELSASQSAAKVTQEACNLRDTMQEVYDSLLPRAQEKSIRLSLDYAHIKHFGIYANPNQLKQLTLNLVNNALAYTNDGGRVDIVLTENEDLPDNRAVYCLEVRDTGIGIQEGFLKEMYEPFARGETSTLSGVQGVGLGLTIVKSIVDQLGGTIAVKSVVNEGSVFTVSIPLRILPPADTLSNQGIARPDLRLLLAEDDSLNREVEAELLQRMGYAVDAVPNGREALEKVEQSAPGSYDLIILDLQMPVMNGWELAAAIRKLPNPALACTPIIALSAHIGFQERRRSLESGIDVHLPKPMDLTVLQDTIEKMTRKHIS